jgi:HK97 family phage portal protein
MAWFSRSKDTEVKSSSKIPSFLTGLYNEYGSDLFVSVISPRFAYKLYHSIGIVKTTISTVTDEVSCLPIVLRDKNEPDKIIRDHEILTLLYNPDENTTKEDFFENMGRSFGLTNEMWMIAKGDVNRKPIELKYCHPYDISIHQESGNLWPRKIEYRFQNTMLSFYREVDNRSINRYRYIDNSRFNELFPMISDQTIGSDFRAANPLTGIKDDLLSFKSSTTANKKTIDNSGRPSGVVSSKTDDVDDETIDMVEKALESYRGAENSGKIMYIPASIETSFDKWSPKDMDDKVLRDDTREDLWNQYKIPLPLMSSSAQTYSNFSEAKAALYDSSINPFSKRIFAWLKLALSTRMDFGELFISYDELEVPALKERAINNMIKRKDTTVITVNENRASGGLPPQDGGDDVLVTANLVKLDTIGMDFGTNNGTN